MGEMNDFHFHDNGSAAARNADVYSFDDLLISSAQEIMVNGMGSEVIPETIKDWLAGKVLRALPKRLTQKLLSFLVDNRDMEATLGFKENQNGDIPEFTLLMYRTAKSKIRKEREGNPNITNQVVENVDQEVVFNGGEPTNEGIEFFSQELVVDQ